MTEMFTFLLQMELEQAFRGASSEIPGRLRRKSSQIDGLKISAGGENIRSSATWGSRGASSNPLPP